MVPAELKYPKIKIEPSRYKWAIEKTDIDEEKIFTTFPKINEWISGKDQPTMLDLSDFSSMTHIPLGYFFLNTPPTESTELLKYRTIQNQPNYLPSQNLLDTIHNMTSIQSWIRGYFIDYINTKNSFVASLKNAATIESMAIAIRKALNIDIDWFIKISSNDDDSKNFDFIRSRIQSLDIIVMMNKIVGTCEERPLDINEFRAFTIIDDYVPLIFINAKDSYKGRIFSLVHEFIHVGIGVDSLFNTDINNDFQICNDIEKMCNAIAYEILVPMELFRLRWRENSDIENLEKISELAKYFKVSELVMARRAHEQKYILNDEYSIINNKFQYNIINTNENEDEGCDSLNNFLSFFDINCLRIINESIKTGYLLYTYAYYLTDLNRTSFDKIMDIVDEQ